MNIQPSTPISTAGQTQNVSMTQGSGGDGKNLAQGLRADWHVNVNILHGQGFVGGAGRLLIHNEKADELTEIAFYLPAASERQPGTLRIESATIVSTKPGMPVAPGQPLLVTPQGMRAVVTLPALKLNDWVYIDVTWVGGFPRGGSAWPGAEVPVGLFHPQVATEVDSPDGTRALALVRSRYEVTCGTDPGATIRVEDEAEPVSRPADDGSMTMHEFRSYGSAAIRARVLPPPRT